ncbi:MAG: DUF6350 family protein [Propionibacteriaceae bacterium]|nr:DUF6350 family protein [Propionibacteriaceae bacterium]
MSGPERKQARTRRLPWALAAVLGGAFVALCGWLLLTGAAVVGWLTAPESDFTAAVGVGTKLWLLSNGGEVSISGLRLSVAPLGVTAVIVLLVTGAAGYAVQQAAGDGALEPGLVAKLSGLICGSYVACVAIAALVTGSEPVRALIGAALIAGASSYATAYRASGRQLSASWPVWARSVPKAISAACLIVVVAGGIALCIGLLLAKDRVVALHEALDPGVAGGVILLLLQLGYLPNFLLWCASWVLGAGFSLGSGTIVSPSENHLGILPSLPVFAAVPPAGPGSWSMLAWLITGLAAGAVAGFIVVWARPRARADETALAGGLAGTVSGVLIVIGGAFGNGALGNARMAEVGVRLESLAVLAPTLLGISGLVTGALLGLFLPPQRPEEPEDGDSLPQPAPVPDEEEETQPLPVSSAGGQAH